MRCGPAGFHREVVLRLASDIIWGLGTAYLVRPESAGTFLRRMEDAGAEAPAFTIPAWIYADELEILHRRFDLWTQDEEAHPLTKEDLGRLQVLCAMGIPEAQYHLGSYRLRQSPETILGYPAAMETPGVGLLEQAAAAGHPDAAALGDHYFRRGSRGDRSRDWGRAYALYTGYGMPALDQERRRALIQMLDRRARSRKVLLICLLSALAVSAAALWTGTGLLSTALCGTASLVVWGVYAVRAYHRPYNGILPLPLSLAVIWILWLMIRVLL